MQMTVSRERWLPRLGWIAQIRSDRVETKVGTHVEIGPVWIAEAVWDGAFRNGGFDRTGAVFGSGVRARGGDVHVVSSAGLVDRVWVHGSGDELRCSNCLPVLLAATGDRLREDVDYRPALRNLPTPGGRPEPLLSTERGEVAAVYRSNLRWDGGRLEVVPKPRTDTEFTGFPAYRDYLAGVARAIGANAGSEEREHPLSLLTTISKGYDSPAVSVLAREAGCRRAATIRQARSVPPRDDSGEEIAAALGLECQVVDRGGRGGPAELAFWAADGRAEDQNLAAFDYPGEVTALFSGAFGGIIWADEEHKHPALADYADRNTLSFCEYRLRNGIIHCPIPYLGYDRAEEILRITRSSEMEPWSIGGDYDRPIPRRILEEAGIPRGAFALRKSATQFEESFSWPHRQELQASYASYLRRVGDDVPPVGWYRFLNALDRTLLLPLQERTPLSFARLRKQLRRPGRRLLNWANNELADRLARRRGGARSSPAEPA